MDFLVQVVVCKDKVAPVADMAKTAIASFLISEIVIDSNLKIMEINVTRN
jgi:hypothetical protein